MKRRVYMLLGATAMSATAMVGASAISATPAAAQTFNPTAAFGYVVGLFSCVFNPPLTIGACLRSNLRGFLGALGLPPTAPNNNSTAPASPAANGGAAPKLSLPSGFLRNLPSQLQTNPVAPIASPSIGTRQVVPTPTVNPTQIIADAKARAASRIANLPKIPQIGDISLLNISDSAPAPTSSNPISSADLLELVGLGVVGAAAVTAATRRRAALRS